MNDPFDMVDIDDAREYFNSFDLLTRQKGEAYFRKGRVKEVVPSKNAKPGTHFVAVVEGSNLYGVDLTYTKQQGWGGHCSCPVEFDCKHIYAGLKALLAEQSLAAVRGISSNAIDNASHSPAVSTPAPKPRERLIQPVSAMAAAALGRPLDKPEASFCRKLTEVYQRCAMSQRISRWDLDDLGLSIGGYGWEPLKLWPHFPQTEHEFWLYVANAVEENRVGFPKFLEPITNLTAVREKVSAWRRSQEIDHWKQLLGSAGDKEMESVSRGEFDLRLMLKEDRAVLEWKRPGRDRFEAAKTGPFRQFVDAYRNGRASIDPALEIMCQLIAGRLLYSSSLELRFKESEALSTVGQLLRAKTLDGRIVSEDGEPMVREAEPVRWELIPATDEKSDYLAQIVRADGSPLKGVLCAIPGRPTLYVTRTRIYTGPGFQDGLLDPLKANKIPAPALETIDGIQFLKAFGMEMPPRIRERIRTVLMNVTIRCEIKPMMAGSSTEDCVFTITAAADDGSRDETWDGNAWEHTAALPTERRPKADPDVFPAYDRSVMQTIPALMEPLGLRAGYTGNLVLRVTRKFPDLFVPWLKSIPPQVDLQLKGELASFKNAAVSGKVRLDVKETAIDWFDLSVVLDVTDTTLTQQEIKLLLNAKGGFVRLANKGWRRLEFDLTQEEDEKLANLGLSPHELSAEPQRLHALQLANESAQRFMPEEQAQKIQRRAAEIKARVTPDLPKGVSADLRPYQLEGFHFLAYLSTNRFGGILADDMGLGKTLQTLSWLLWLRSQPDAASVPSLVVCPKSVMDNWRAEAERFTPGIRVKTWSSGEYESMPRQLDQADLHVINYSQLRMAGHALQKINWLAVILDEGQYIKNPQSQTAQAARQLRSQHRLALSGTPIENRLVDLWSLMAFAMPGILGTRAQFGRIYDSKDDPLARKRLAARVRPFLLRRTKSQVATDLPDRVEEDLLCELEGEQQLLYRAELKRAQQMLLKVKTDKSLAQHRFHFLTSLLRLRQICCHPALVNPASKASSAKMDSLMEQLEPLMEEGEKVLVFSQFVDMLNILKPAMDKAGWKTFYLAGETENRGDLVREFQAHEGAAVFLISLKAGGFGLNLTAASYVVLYDPWWNPAVESQAIDRTHRIGQANKVVAYRLLIKDSVEEKIRSLQKTKSALADDVLGEEKFSQSLSLDDLQFLFSD